jgi:tetratricopeptide (TPR) repeat protein
MASYKEALKINPNYADAHNNLGAVYKLKGQLDAAVGSYKTAISTAPQFTEAYINLGLCLYEQGDLDGALDYYDKGIKINPYYRDAFNSRGMALMQKGDFEAAIGSYRKAIEIDGNYGAAYNNLAVVLQQQGDFDAALENCKKAIEIDPKHADAYANMGLTLQSRGALEAALKSYKKAIEINTKHTEAHFNMGNVQMEIGDLGAAIDSYEKALKVKPDHSEAMLNKSLVRLHQNNFVEGWNLYEQRWAVKDATPPRLNTNKPMWKPLESGRVLLWAEQGVGDEVMFASTIPQLYAKSDKLIIQIDDRLIPLFKRSFPEDIIYYSNKDKVPESEYDFHIPMGSTLKYFRTNLDSFKQAENGYLKSDAARSAKLRKKLAINDCDYLVGISWRGGSEVNRLTKSMQLSQIVNALPNKKVKIINLQYGDTDHERQELETVNGIIIHNVSEVDNFNDIDGLASLIDACDQVVSISTTAVHLAGALGKKTTVLLPFSCDWRWGRNGSDSYWYSSVRLLRQEKISDWSDPLAKLHLEFE